VLLPFAPTKARARVVVVVSVVVSVSVSVSVVVRVGCFFLAQSFCIGRRRSAFVEPFVLCVLFFCTLLLFLSLSLSTAPFSIMVPLNVRVKPLTEERHHHHQTKLPLLPSS